jgi:hypothetical protein
MFRFFKKKQEQREAAEAKMRTFNAIVAQVSSGKGSMLEAALVLHLTERNQESLARLLTTFGSSDLWILSKGDERLGDPAVTEGSDGAPYVAAFTSTERAAEAAVEWTLPNRPAQISAMELVFALNMTTGIVLNANEPHFQWSFTPQHVSNLRKLFEGSHHYELGGIYSVWTKGAFGAVKLLRVDDGGVHIRVYGNVWQERPASIDLEELTLDRADEHSVRPIGHMPVVRASFLAMGPRLVVCAPVTDAELDGYAMWAEEKGGYFGS